MALIWIWLKTPVLKSDGCPVITSPSERRTLGVVSRQLEFELMLYETNGITLGARQKRSDRLEELSRHIYFYSTLYNTDGFKAASL